MKYLLSLFSTTRTTDSVRPGRMGEFLARWCRACASGALFTFALFAQIETPRIGFWRDAQNRVRSLHGVAGNFIPGVAVREGVVAFAWYGDGGWLRSADGIERLDASGATVARLPDGEARFSASGAWLTNLNVVYRWDGRSLKNEPVDAAEFAVPDVEADRIEPIGQDWWHLRLRGRSYALRTTPGREARFEIPEAEDEAR